MCRSMSATDDTVESTVPAPINQFSSGHGADNPAFTCASGKRWLDSLD